MLKSTFVLTVALTAWLHHASALVGTRPIFLRQHSFSLSKAAVIASATTTAEGDGPLGFVSVRAPGLIAAGAIATVSERVARSTPI